MTNTLASMVDTPALAQSDTAFSRSAGLLSGQGSADDGLKTRVAHEVADDWRKLARELGMSTSELLRITVLVRLYGVNGVASMTLKSLEKVAGNGTEKGHEL